MARCAQVLSSSCKSCQKGQRFGGISRRRSCDDGRWRLSFFWPLDAFHSIPERLEFVDCWEIAGAVKNVVAQLGVSWVFRFAEPSGDEGFRFGVAEASGRRLVVDAFSSAFELVQTAKLRSSRHGVAWSAL